MPSKPKQQQNTDRVAIISAVKTYLGFFVLLVLVVEAVLGTIALQAEGSNQLVALYGMLSVIGVLIVVVSFFAYRKPDALLRGIASHQEQDLQSAQNFSRRIAGYWWERIQPDEPSAISMVEIYPDPATYAVKMKGNVYNKRGELTAFWESVACCINTAEGKLFYYWKGWHPLRPNEPYEGFGEISFNQSTDVIDSGMGFFSDTNLTNMKSTTKKSIVFRRCEEQDIHIMRTGKDKSVSELILAQLG